MRVLLGPGNAVEVGALELFPSLVFAQHVVRLCPWRDLAVPDLLYSACVPASYPVNGASLNETEHSSVQPLKN